MTISNRVNILLVDDKPANLLVLEAVLADIDQNLVRAASGEEALRRVLETDFAAILLDVRMPTMSGFETARLIRSRSRSKTTPILFVTASDDSDLSLEEAYALGAVDFLTKPVVPAVLKAKVAVFVDLYRSKEELRAAERRAVEATFREQKELWQTTLGSIGDAVIATDTARRVTFLNHEAERLTGWSQAQAVGKDLHEVFSVVNEITRQPVECTVERVLETGRVAELANQTILVARDGSERPIDKTAAPIRAESGEVYGVVLVIRDITEKREAARKLQEAHDALERGVAERTAELSGQRAFLAAVLEAIEDGIVACDSSGVLTLFNRATREFHGLPEAPLPAQRWSDHYDLYRPDGITPLPLQEIPLFRALSGEHVRDAEMVIAPKAGKHRTVLAGGRALLDEAGRKLGAVVSMHDITARLEARAAREAALQEQARRMEAEAAAESVRASKEQFALLLESSGEGIYGMGPDGRCTFINTAGAALLGYRPQELIGQSLHDIIHHHRADGSEYPVAECAINQAARGAAPVRVHDEVFWHKDGTAVPVAYSVSPMASGNKPAGAVITFSDITERKRTEEDLRRLAAELSESDRRKTEFLATLAHELRNPLAPLRNGLQIMRLAADNPAAIATARDMMERQVAHMAHLVDDLLDIARITRGTVELKKERVDLKRLVAGAVETSLPLIEASSHALIVDVPDEPLNLEADPTRITQVVGNLLNNAAKYTPNAGRIELAARRVGTEVIVSVSDTGIGIPEESLATVFEMFTQVGRNMDRAQGGLGIGLSLVRTLVELHGGTVSVTSPGVGKGSTFKIRLPLANHGVSSNALLPQPHVGTSAATPSTLRVLVVDDNVDAAQSLSALLRTRGHLVHVADNDHQALQKAQTFRPNVIFLDIGMPQKNGHEVAQALRATSGLEQVTLVALTRRGSEDDRARSEDAGFDDQLSQPAELAAIDGLLSKLGYTKNSQACP